MPCADDQVSAVRRALDLLDAFGIDEPRLSMAELARRVGLPKTSALRLARTLAASGYLVQTEKRDWRLGPSTAWLATRYQMAFDLKGAVRPALHALAQATHRPATFFVREGEARIRLMRVEADADSRAAPVGEQLPLDKGSPGKVILAFLGKRGKLFDDIRQRGYHITIGEARKPFASVSAPVFGVGWSVIGAINISCASEGASEPVLEAYASAVVAAGRSLSSALMRWDDKTVKPPKSYWHP
ncbi:helix-turn-helix domain-containing protein [Candidimonas humi]|nr:helix-turn-helix domain-containing protein [Candidimonas humi]MBV6304546.1 helix-turn-helix domain-containing protein [Candidimonas humi]